jgi:D-glycero-alpha-D-manno-heptose-7-phosphate kinase
MRVSATAPCRVDLAGATLDIWPLYLFHHRAVTVNFAVDVHARCDIATRGDSRIVLRSRDLRKEESFESLDELNAANHYLLPLLALPVRFFAPTRGVVVESLSESPAGAGISGSSALMIAVICALNKLCGRKYTKEKIREIAQNIEAQVIRVPTGSQDYYPALHGGVSAIEYGPDGIARRSLPVNADDLNDRFVLAYTGAPRNSGINNWEVMKAHIDGNRRIQRNFDRIAQIANAMRDAVARSDWEETGRLMRAEWTSRRKNAPGISTPAIDHLVAATRRAGSTGAKACGAGGGGCVVFLVEPGAKAAVARLIEQAGARVLPAKVALRGVVVH